MVIVTNERNVDIKILKIYTSSNIQHILNTISKIQYNTQIA